MAILTDSVLQNAINEIDAERLRRAAVQENSARVATHVVRYQSSGTGYIVPPAAFTFDVKFQNEPAITTGCALIKQPDLNHYGYPVITAGVFKWEQDANGLYTGAHLFFVVDVQPKRMPRTDGSNLTLLEAQKSAAEQALANSFPGTVDHDYQIYNLSAAKALVDEATEAKYLVLNPAACVVDHFLTFTEVAMKGMPDDVLDTLHSDPEILPITNSMYGDGSGNINGTVTYL